MNDIIKQKFTELRNNYSKKLKNKISMVETMWENLLKHWEQEELQNLYRLVHNLYGSSSTYGFTDISNIVCDLEKNITPLLKRPPSIDEKQSIQKLIAQLVRQEKKIVAK